MYANIPFDGPIIVKFKSFYFLSHKDTRLFSRENMVRNTYCGLCKDKGQFWFNFCFTAPQHILDHFGCGQLP